jgi:hypothetical protein
MTQGGVQGALLGVAVSSKLRTSDAAALAHAIKNDFIFSGLIAGTLDGLIKMAESGVDLTDKDALLSAAATFFSNPSNVANAALDFAAVFVNAGADWAALGSVPSAVFKVDPAAVVGGGYLRNMTSGQITRLPFISRVAENYWRNLLGQTSVRAVLGVGNDVGNQLSQQGGDVRKISGERALLSGVGSAMYPAVMQTLQRGSLLLARLPAFRHLADTSRIPINAPSGRGVTFTQASRVSDTRTPFFAYGGRAGTYGVMITLLKNEFSKGLTAEEAIANLQKMIDRAQRDPEYSEKLASDPALPQALEAAGRLSFIQTASLLGGWVPNAQTAARLEALHDSGVDIDALLRDQPYPQLPANETEWADPQRVARFHREIDAMVDKAYARWKSR